MGDIDKEMETYRIWMEEYPRDWLPVDSLAVDLSLNFNDYEQAAQLFRHSMINVDVLEADLLARTVESLFLA